MIVKLRDPLGDNRWAHATYVHFYVELFINETAANADADYTVSWAHCLIHCLLVSGQAWWHFHGPCIVVHHGTFHAISTLCTTLFNDTFHYIPMAVFMLFASCSCMAFFMHFAWQFSSAFYCISCYFDPSFHLYFQLLFQLIFHVTLRVSIEAIFLTVFVLFQALKKWVCQFQSVYQFRNISH